MRKEERTRRAAWAAEAPLVLKDFQRALLDSLRGKSRVALYSGLGTGKTITSLAKAEEIAESKAKGKFSNGGDKEAADWKAGDRENVAVLVVCQVSQVEDWLHNALRQCKGWSVYSLRDNSEALGFFNDTGRRIGVINYDMVWRKQELLKLKNHILILDESSLISNRTSKRTKACMKIGKDALGVICASATPVSGKYENLISQCWLLGWKIPVQEFWDTYVLYSLWTPPGTYAQVKQVRGYRNIDDLIRNLETVCNARFLRSESVIDLPEETDTDIYCETTKEYKAFLKNYYIEINGTEFVGDSSIARRTYMRQLAGAYNPGKETALLELLERTEDRMIIFYSFDSELEVIRRVCKKLNKHLFEQNGHKHEQEDFKQKPGSIIAIQYQSGGRGLNLQCCNCMTFFSPSDMCELYTQARGRIRRMGQERPCHYYHLICRHSIDEDIREAIALGQDYTNDLFVMQYPGREIL